MSNFGGSYNNSRAPPPGGFPFGSAPPSAPFGSSGGPQTGGFGAPNASFGGGGAGGGFGTSPGGAVQPTTTFAAPTSFGRSSGFPSTNQSQASSLFPAPSDTTAFGPPFGNTPSSASGFGHPQQQQSTFGQSSSFPQHSSGFGTSSFGTPFGGTSPQQQQQQASNIPNPFGGPSSGAPTPAVSFGRSSNVVTGSTMSTPGFQYSSSNFASAPSSSGFANSAPAPSFGSIPFGSNTAFGMPNNNSAGGDGAVADDDDDLAMGSSSPVPGASTFASPFGNANNIERFESISPVPEDSMGDDGQDQLAKLKAKIEAKKKRLVDRQKRKGPESQRVQHQEKDQQQALKSKGSHRRQGSQSMTPPPPNSESSTATSNTDNQLRAERNAIRFAASQNTATSAFLPSDLKEKTDGTLETTTTSGVAAGLRGDLASAKSLEGTCQSMCPDEELLRRERENDIQLLEIPDPGGIHPSNWTLRNTAVKRFRRSAADYKLDVPEWVRPPDVLEEVCSYLEEWVMERDRQGPDPRFPNNGTPNSLDVYQFIWDRTRMIRKDFILQNYVGTGGKCDARAVRCHERIARWHAMCEHQLSHISDFVVHQSQQNIQELGQAMKTLNQYYDDSLGRATVDVPDKDGRETRTDTAKQTHGCKSDIVQGANPVDYDGTPLNNRSDNSSLVSNRLIGQHMANSPSRGTAEPEMRGLYILLTMNNEGGMEVMRYSATLYRERREIYDSRPVQLALDIFKAKKDYNYVRFFAILSDPETPYLFACIMFKHVELMRKVAFRVMSKTFGAKKKEDGEPIYDAYPLKKLAHILCFEDMDEARAACKHYNITVKEMRVRSSSSPAQSGTAEIIFWRHSEFKEPKDPDKGTTIPCRPKKMMKYIESKLHGATRLGVCRGQVSGEGASLSSNILKKAPVAPSVHGGAAAAQASLAYPNANQLDERTNLLIHRQQELFREEQAKSNEAAEENEAKQKEHREQERKMAEKNRLEMLEAKKIEQERQEEERQKQKEQEKLEAAQRQREEEQYRRQQQEKEKREQAEKAALEQKRRREEEHQRQLQEEARRKAEAEERERQRQEAIRREEERRREQIRIAEEKRRQAEAEKIRKEQERKRQEASRQREEERKRREAEAVRKAKEVEQRVNLARKVLLLRRWRESLPRKLQIQRNTKESLSRIDPTFSKFVPFKENPIELGLAVTMSPVKAREELPLDTRRVLNRMLAKCPGTINTPSLLLDSLCDDQELLHYVKSNKLTTAGTDHHSTVFLFKIAIILPEPEGLDEQSMYELVHTWLFRRLGYGEVHATQRQCADEKQSFEVRIIFTKADSWSGRANCDAAMIVIPPSFCNGDWNNSRKGEAIAAAFACIDEETPRLAYILGEQSGSEYYQTAKQFLLSYLPDVSEFPVVFPSAISEKTLDGSLRLSLKSLFNILTQEFPPIVEQVSVIRLASSCIFDTLWKNSGTASLLEISRAVLQALAEELDNIWPSVEESWFDWPAEEFAGEGGLIRDYFDRGLHLPSVWTSSVFCDSAKSKILDLYHVFENNSIQFAISKLIYGAPIHIRDECEAMLHARQYRKCIQTALQWSSSFDEIFYLPLGTAGDIGSAAVRSVLGETGDHLLQFREYQNYDDEVENEGPEMVSINDAQKEVPDTVTDESPAFHKPQDVFEISRRSPQLLPETMATPTNANNTPAPPETASPPPGILSNKRNWIGMTSGDGGFQETFSPTSSAAKRLRRTTSPQRSLDIAESSAYTKKLQDLLNGDATVDVEVGGTTLARLMLEAPRMDQHQQTLMNVPGNRLS